MGEKIKAPKHYELKECAIVEGKAIPFCRLAPTFLEKSGKKQLFSTQETVDRAWTEGFHSCGKPETAEKMEKAKPVEKKKEVK